MWTCWNCLSTASEGISYNGHPKIILLVRNGQRNDQKIKHNQSPRGIIWSLAMLYTVFELKLGCSGAAALIGDEVL